MKNLLIFTLPLLIFTISLEAQFNQEWASRYNGSGNALDQANAIAVDNSGNVYVTGFITISGYNYDYVTIKYNSSGSQQWISFYNGLGNYIDQAEAIAVDNAGNVYVTGSSYINSVSSDYATIKYNSAGVEQWVTRYNGPGNGNDIALSIVLDVSGNIIVTGASTGSGGATDYATVKYNPAGVQQWAARYTGPGNIFDQANSVTTDAAGNVYVTGYIGVNGSGLNYATVKYNSAGAQQWEATYTSPGVAADNAFSIAVDASGNVYVTGSSVETATGSNCATIKYNSAGVQQWISKYNGNGNDDDKAYSIVLDNTANIYITGLSTGSGSGYDYITIKYNTAGVEQWASSYNGPANSNDIAYSLAIDAPGNVYVTGASGGNGTNNDYATIKYNSIGVQQWVARYNGPPGNGDDESSSIALDGSGNVYVTGYSKGNGSNYDLTTIKYSSVTGTQIINTEVPGSYSLSQNYPNPFNPATKIEFSIPKSSFVKLAVFDVTGRELETLLSDNLTPGLYKADWDASKYSSGIYFYTLTSDSYHETKKMILIK